MHAESLIHQKTRIDFLLIKLGSTGRQEKLITLSVFLANSDRCGAKCAGQCTKRLMHTFNNEASHCLGIRKIEFHRSMTFKPGLLLPMDLVRGVAMLRRK